MATAPPSPPEVQQLADLARQFADQKRFGEALELYHLALRLEPRNLRLRLALAQTRKQYRPTARARSRSIAEATRDALRRDAIDAAHFCGLANLYQEKGESFRALECLEIARLKHDIDPAGYKLAGRIHYRLQDYDAAAQLLERALRFDPFDREAAELLGQIEYERKQFEPALAATIDAFLLLARTDDEDGLRLRRRIRTLRELAGWKNSQVVALFRVRQEALHTAFDRLEWRRERFREEYSWLEGPSAVVEPESPAGAPGRLDLAARLRKSEVWSHLTDEQIFKLSGAVGEERRERGETLLATGSTGRELYLVDEGEISIQRTTPYGTYPLALLGPGALFGEIAFLTGGERTASAVAAKRSRLLRFDPAGLDELAGEWAEFGVQIYWGLWHSLAAKLRSTNEQLRTFFPADNQPENFLRLRRGRGAEEGAVAVTSDDKIRLFREQGLSSRELETLATFSRERRFAAGGVIFEEGDEGKELYVVLDGKVRISKFIAGAGEEALAILERGDFFGEMSLIDGALRSADAHAHGGPVTVLTLDQARIQEMLALDPTASLDFLRLLCRLIARRLREIDDKVIGWRILAGDRHTGALA